MVPHRSFRMFALAAFALAATPAWAVVGSVNITVTDTSGRPVPGATISLTTPAGAAVTETTDSDGRVVLRDVEEGSHAVTISGADVRRTKSRVTVRGGQTTEVGLVAPPLLARAPAGCIGCLAAGPTAMLDSASDMPIIVNRSTITDTAQGRGSRTETIDHDLDESNREFDHRARIDAAGLEVAFGIGGRSMPAGLRALGLGASSGMRAQTAMGGAPGSGGGAKRFHPSLVLAVGRASAELEYENLADPSSSAVYEGSGLVLGGGVDATWFLGDGGWYTGAGYRYQRLLDTDVRRRQPLAVDGGRLIGDEYTLRHQVQVAHVVVGYGTRHVAPWAGVRGVFRTSRLDGNFAFDFAQFFGFPVTSSFVLQNEFEENTVQGVAGVDVRIPRTRLFARAEGSFGGGTTSAGVKLTYGFGL